MTTASTAATTPTTAAVEVALDVLRQEAGSTGASVHLQRYKLLRMDQHLQSSSAFQSPSMMSAKPELMRRTCQEAVQCFPLDRTLVEAFVDAESRFRIDNRVRSTFDQLLRG